MRAQIPDVPRGGGAAAPELGHDVHDGDEGQLHASEGLRLMKAEEPRLVQELLVVAQEGARVLALLGALAQRGHQGSRAAHRLVVVDTGEVTPGRLGQGPHGVPALCHHGHVRLLKATITCGADCRAGGPAWGSAFD